MADLFKKGICPECNLEIDVDSSKDAVICEYCDNPISVKKAIGKYAMAHKEEMAARAKEEAVNKGRKAAENVVGFAFGISDSIKEAKAEKERKAREEEQRKREEAEREAENRRILRERAREQRKVGNAARLEWMKNHKKIVAVLVVALIALMVAAGAGHAYKEAKDTRIKVPASSSSLCTMKYEEAKQQLEKAGFTNISLEPEYDVVLGLFAKVGDVAGVSIDGKTSFSGSSKFDAEAPVIITYHMDVTDDPEYTKDEKENNKESSATAENKNLPEANDYVKRAAVVMWTNSVAEDVWDEYGEHQIPSKFHSYSDMSGNTNDYFIFVDDWGKWSAIAENQWRVDGIMLRKHDNYNTISRNTLNMVVSYDSNKDTYVISGLEYSSKELREKLIPFGESEPEYIVPSALVAEDRDAIALDRLDKTDELPKEKSLTAFRKAGEQVFPYGFKAHSIAGVHYWYQMADGSWNIKMDVTIKNQYGTKRDAVASAYINNVTKSVENFTVY